MFLLLLFAFLAGLITILSPCILPVLPIVLAGSATGGSRRPLGIITGFVLSFTFFTLFTFALISFLGLSPNTLRYFAITILGLFGLSLLIPEASDVLKKAFSKLANFNATHSSPTPNRSGYWGGVIVGLSLGLIWTPCVGPIISSVITLAATSSVTWQAAALTFAYTLGTAIPMFAIMIGGRALLNRIPWLLSNTEKLQKAFGVIMIIIALAMTFGIDRKFQTLILDAFPSYGTGLTKIEDNEAVKIELESLGNEPTANSPQPIASPSSILDLTRYPTAPNPNFTGATKWLNSGPLTLEKLKGKVVLVDFWTYTCINCIRTLPYLTSWDAKYADQDLVIIGVHSPEFAFEKEEKNVLSAMKQYGINYPVVQDNNFNIWKSYANRYWPAKYLIDAQGRIRDTHFGEGAYEETERKIQELLKEAGMANVDKEVTKEIPVERTGSITPETYLGLDRMERFVDTYSDERPQRGVRSYGGPDSALSNPGQWTVVSRWDFDGERAMPKKSAKLLLNFAAEKVFLVMRGRGKVKVTINGVRVDTKAGFQGRPITEYAGKDAKTGTIDVTEDRLYELVDFPENGVGSLELEFLDDGIELYAFTFG